MHNLNREELIGKLDVNLDKGLTENEAKKRLIDNGYNTLKEQKTPSLLERFIEQFKDFMIIVLIAAAGVSYIVSGHATDSIVILLVVLLNAVLGVFQESRAEKSLEALKKMAAPNAKVMREGKLSIIPAKELVVGDVINVEAGDLVPADARIIECGNLKVEESALTGESLPVEKHDDIISEKDIALGDRKNMIYSSTVATYGRAVAVVTAVGMNSECGKIADALAGEEDEQTPLQKRLAQIGTYLGVLAMVICAVIFAMGMANGTEFVEIFMTAVTLAVAAIPEGLPAIVTIVLAMGVQRLVKRNAIIRKLPAVETLGSASVICSDKTGTLTLNRMTVTNVYCDDKILPLEENKEHSLKVLSLAALCNDAQVNIGGEGKYEHIGDPTESAMIAAVMAIGKNKEDYTGIFPRIAEVPFDSDRKLMSTVHKDGDRIFVAVKGAPDRLIDLCPNVNREQALKANEDMAKQGMRVLAVAKKELKNLPEEISSATLECELEFVGLLGMIDPPREEAKLAVAQCKEAGIKTVMITGDHKDTAIAIATQLGILSEGNIALNGTELDGISDEELKERIADIRVYARVSPEHKIRIVKAWKAIGQVVAMTGDGVNDAPALKAADIGCAMGITGTEVSKGAADMILTDDNFATITAAVEEGRSIYQNIKKCITFLLSSNLGEVLAIFFAMLGGLGTPLFPTQILWVNLVTDSLPAMALGVEPLEDDIMKKPPIPAGEGFFTKATVIKIMLMGVMISALTLTGYVMGLNILPEGGKDVANTMAFMTLALGQLFHALNLKSDRSLFSGNLFNNKYLILALVGGLVLQAVIYFVPFLAEVFSVVALTGAQLITVAVLSVAPILIMEIIKLIKK